MTKIEEIQAILGVIQDDRWERNSQHALDIEIAKSQTRHGSVPERIQNTVTLGDGTWAFRARIDGDDVVVGECRITCFGGGDDPQDSGETASGISTKSNPGLAACALPMDGRYFPGLSRSEHLALDGSPIPRVPWRTIVTVEIDGITLNIPAIDLGPAKRTKNGLDLTIAAARLVKANASATDFEAKGSYRVVGAAKYIKGFQS